MQTNDPQANNGFESISRRMMLRGAVVGAAAAISVGELASVAEAATKRTKKQKLAKPKAIAPTTSVASAKSPTVSTALASNSCVLTPEMTEGPFYLDLNKVRADVTEGRPGAPLQLNLSVLSTLTCTPIADAAVDIWHTDALGTYSGVSGDNGTFMRGTLVTDKSGNATFKTVVPGWYQGRTVHIHVMVHVGGNVVHTGQIFFDDTFLDNVFKEAPYNKRGARDTRNSSDGIFRGGGSSTLLAPSKAATGYVANLSMGVGLA